MILSFFSRSPLAMQILLYAAGALLITCIGLGVIVKIQSAELDAAQARQEALGEKIGTQNKAVQTWKASAELQAFRAAEATHRAEEVRTKTAERVRNIAGQQVPAVCPEAVKWGASQAIEFNKRWGGETK